MRLPDQKNLNANINAEVFDAFETQKDKYGWNKYRAVEAALKAFMAMPAELQVRIISAEPSNNIYPLLIRGLVDAEIAKHLDNLGPTREKFLALLAQVKGKKPPKRS